MFRLNSYQLLNEWFNNGYNKLNLIIHSPLAHIHIYDQVLLATSYTWTTVKAIKYDLT